MSLCDGHDTIISQELSALNDSRAGARANTTKTRIWNRNQFRRRLSIPPDHHAKMVWDCQKNTFFWNKLIELWKSLEKPNKNRPLTGRCKILARAVGLEPTTYGLTASSWFHGFFTICRVDPDFRHFLHISVYAPYSCFLVCSNYVAKNLHYRVATCAKNIQKRECTNQLLRNIFGCRFILYDVLRVI